MLTLNKMSGLCPSWFDLFISTKKIAGLRAFYYNINYNQEAMGLLYRWKVS